MMVKGVIKAIDLPRQYNKLLGKLFMKGRSKMKKIVSKYTMVISLILGLVSGLILNASISPAAASSEKVINLTFQGKWYMIGYEAKHYSFEKG